MSDTTHKAAIAALKQLGVHVKLNTLVTSFKDEQALLSDGSVIHAKTLLWTAGVVARAFEGIDVTSLGKGRRMVTDAYNRVQGYQNIFAIGDISIQFTDPDYPNGHPQLAQPAIQQGKRLAKNLLAMAKGRPLKPFKYFDRGDMAIIGRKFAVADLFKHKVHLGGILGLVSWLFIHVISLVNYNNKIKTLYNWGVAYITSDQALRMIFQTEKEATGTINIILTFIIQNGGKRMEIRKQLTQHFRKYIEVPEKESQAILACFRVITMPGTRTCLNRDRFADTTTLSVQGVYGCSL